MVRFTVPGEPVQWKRANTRGKQRYNDPAHAAQAEAVLLFWRQTRAKPFEGPVTASARFFVTRPKRHYRVNGQLKDWALDERPAVYPDLDNYLKLVWDALNGWAYKDDGQIVQYAPPPEKLYVAGLSDEPRTEVLIAEYR